MKTKIESWNRLYAYVVIPKDALEQIGLKVGDTVEIDAPVTGGISVQKVQERTGEQVV